MLKSARNGNKTGKRRLRFIDQKSECIPLDFNSRMGVGTQFHDIKINPIFSRIPTFPLESTLSVEDLSIDMGSYGGIDKWRMFTLTGIMFIQNNGSRNADQFENLTKSIAIKAGNTITRELLFILQISVHSEMLVPICRWMQILESCERGKIV